MRPAPGTSQDRGPDDDGLILAQSGKELRRNALHSPHIRKRAIRWRERMGNEKNVHRLNGALSVDEDGLGGGMLDAARGRTQTVTRGDEVRIQDVLVEADHSGQHNIPFEIPSSA